MKSHKQVKKQAIYGSLEAICLLHISLIANVMKPATYSNPI